MTYLHPDIVEGVVAGASRYVEGSTGPSVVIPSILMGLDIIIMMGLLLEIREGTHCPLRSHSLHTHGSRYHNHDGIIARDTWRCPGPGPLPLGSHSLHTHDIIINIIIMMGLLLEIRGGAHCPLGCHYLHTHGSKHYYHYHYFGIIAGDMWKGLGPLPHR